MEQARDWVDYAGLAGTFVGVLGIAAWAWGRWDRNLQAFIASPGHRAQLIDRHECRAAEGYYTNGITPMARKIDPSFFVPAGPLADRHAPARPPGGRIRPPPSGGRMPLFV